MECETKWVVKKSFKKQFSVEELLKLILKNREIKNVEEFLHPDVSQIPSFKKLFDSKSAAKKIVKAIKENKKIVVYGDYDVDGISGTCLLWSFLYFELPEFLKLDRKNINVLPYIPDRFDEGYGLSKQSQDKLVAEKVDLVITVDCGIRDRGLIEEYSDIEFVVTDHHLPPDDILEDLKYTIVHQLYPGKEYPFASVCGAFVVFLLILAIKDLVGMESSFEKNKQYLDLVALPTVTDIMPLHGVNRIVVQQGLEVMRSGERLGLKKLFEKTGIEAENISAYHLGYVVGPRLNASGRIGSAMDSLKLLATSSTSSVVKLVNTLEDLNSQRQKLTNDILAEAREKVMEDGLKTLLFVSGENWNEGVIGLVASKLQEEFNRPVLVVSESEDEVRGSARSVNGFNITDAIGEFEELLIKFGGHSQAAGFSVKEGKLNEFREGIVKYVEENMDKDFLIKKMEIDASLNVEHINMDVAQGLETLEPFGYGNRRPVFLLEKVVVASKRVLGKEQNHMKLELKGEGNELLEAMFFYNQKAIEGINVDDVVDIVGCIGINEWNNLKKVQFEVRDWRTCNDSV